MAAMRNPRVFVFGSRRSKILGFSLREDGANLPAIQGPASEWRFLTSIDLKKDALAGFQVKDAMAFSDLIVHGYHVAQPAAKVDAPVASKRRPWRQPDEVGAT
jgi:hypothetical protein